MHCSRRPRARRRGTWRDVVTLLALALMGGAAWTADDADHPDTDIWRKVRADVFGERPIARDAAGRIRLELPARAADAAVVPVFIRVTPRPGEARPMKIHLFIDRNPSPIAGIFEFGAASASTELETRVRIEEYTWVRVVAENADGSLLETERFIKAAGGCSAPAGKSLAERLAGKGQMKWRIDPPADAASPVSVLLMIRHPNNSGLAMDQLTHLYDPAYYVRSVRVTRAGKLVFSADVDFSISENPAFRFSVRPGDGELRATVVDSNEQTYQSTAP